MCGLRFVPRRGDKVKKTTFSHRSPTCVGRAPAWNAVGR
jgi:hypothetical protein